MIEPLQACARIVVAGSHRGTGYLITERWVVTCHHTVKEVADDGLVTVQFSQHQRQARVIRADKDNDCAILELDRSLDGVTPLTLVDQCRPASTWEAFGFPANAGEGGLWLTGDVTKTGKDRSGREVIALFSREVAAGQGARLQGFSGTPVLIDGAVAGHMRSVIGDDSTPPRAEYGLVYACPARFVMELANLQPRRSGPIPPPGAAFNAAWYVRRTAIEDDALNRVRASPTPVIIVGPERFGKTSTLNFLYTQLEADPNVKVLRFNLALLSDAAKRTPEDFYKALTDQVIDTLGGTPNWIDKQLSGSLRLQTLMEDHVLSDPDKTIVVAIDQLDKIRATEFFKEFLGVLRSWADNSIVGPWSRCRFLLSMSMAPAAFARIEASPLNLDEPIELLDLERDDLAQIARIYGLPPTDLETLIETVGGHPYLARLAMYRAALSKRSLSEIVNEKKVFESYLKTQRQRIQKAKLEAEFKLASGGAPISTEAFYLFEAAGMIIGQPEQPLLRYRIYRGLLA
jgi:hypothetical protein